MGLEHDLCRKAKELYGWELKFAGNLITLDDAAMLDLQEWITTVPGQQIALASCRQRDLPTYGFVSPQSQNVYQHFTTIFPGREHDYQEDLIRNALLHLRKLSPPEPRIELPAELGAYVRSPHLSLLQPDNKEVGEFERKILSIIDHGNAKSYGAAFGLCHVNPKLS